MKGVLTGLVAVRAVVHEGGVLHAALGALYHVDLLLTALLLRLGRRLCRGGLVLLGRCLVLLLLVLLTGRWRGLVSSLGLVLLILRGEHILQFHERNKEQDARDQRDE